MIRLFLPSWIRNHNIGFKRSNLTRIRLLKSSGSTTLSHVHICLLFYRLQLLTGPVQNLPLASAEPVPPGAPPTRDSGAARASIGYLQLRTQLLRQQLARGTDLQSTKSFSFTTGEEGGTTPAGSNLSTPSRNRGGGGRPRSVSFQAVLSCGSGMGLPYFDPTPK
jgi:hypothetical protein